MPIPSASISLILNQQISYAVYHVPAGTYSLPEDSGKLTHEILVNLGLITRSSTAALIFPPPPSPAASAAAVAAAMDTTATATAASRTRTVSKKMKDAFLASGKTEDDLKRVIKAYKDASDADIASAGGDFVSFASHTLATAAALTPPPAKKAKTEKASAKTKPRLAWSAAEKKVFKDIVTDVTEGHKAEFAAYIAAKSDDDFNAFAMAGHMRAWYDARVEPCAGAGHHTPAEHDVIRSMANLTVKDDDEEEEEDLIDIEINEEQLLIGSKTGDIFQPCEAGDIKLGTAGVGKYKDVSIPPA
jgi:hypothetical protein